MDLIVIKRQCPWSVFSLKSPLKRGFYIISLTITLSCTPKSCERKKLVVEPVATVVTAPKKTKEQYDKELKDATRLRVLVQALAIEQAAWKVLLEKQEGDVTSVFYPIVRAFGKNQARVPVPRGKNICDQFVIDSSNNVSEILMICRSGGKSFATYRETSQTMDISFHNKELGEIIGLGPSLTAKDAVCKIFWEKNSLTKMECKGLSRERGPEEVVNLKSLNYVSGSSELLKLEGQVLKNLIPVSHINMNVPVTGAIAVTETWLPPLPTMEDIQSEESVKTPPPKAATKSEDEQYETDGGAGEPLHPEVSAEGASVESAPIGKSPPPPIKSSSEPQIEVDPGSVRNDGPPPELPPRHSEDPENPDR